MRKLKLQMQMSINGFVGGPNGELDWMTWDWSEDIKTYVTDLTNSMDTIILGRKLAEGAKEKFRKGREKFNDLKEDFEQRVKETVDEFA